MKAFIISIVICTISISLLSQDKPAESIPLKTNSIAINANYIYHLGDHGYIIGIEGSRDFFKYLNIAIGIRFFHSEDYNEQAGTSNWSKAPGIYANINGVIPITYKLSLKPGIGLTYQRIEIKHSYPIDDLYTTTLTTTERLNLNILTSLDYRLGKNLSIALRPGIYAFRSDYDFAIGAVLGYVF